METIYYFLKLRNISHEVHGMFLIYEGFYFCYGLEIKEYTEQEANEIVRKIRNNCMA